MRKVGDYIGEGIEYCFLVLYMTQVFIFLKSENKCFKYKDVVESKRESGNNHYERDPQKKFQAQPGDFRI